MIEFSYDEVDYVLVRSNDFSYVKYAKTNMIVLSDLSPDISLDNAVLCVKSYQIGWTDAKNRIVNMIRANMIK